MGTINISNYIKKVLVLLVCIALPTTTVFGFSILQEDADSINNEYVEYNGIVVDSETGDALVFATLTVSNTNMSTITN